MVQGVVAHGVPLLHHAPHQIRVLIQVVAHQEERGRHLVFFQNIQDFGGAAVFVARVKGQIDDLFFGVSQVDRVVFRQLLGACRTDGRLPFFPEGQSPVHRLHGRMGHIDHAQDDDKQQRKGNKTKITSSFHFSPLPEQSMRPGDKVDRGKGNCKVWRG